jgi:hypothetical protein
MVADGTISVSSLSHLYLIIGTLKAAIWDLCQNDPNEGTLTPHHFISMKNLSESALLNIKLQWLGR